MHTKSKGQHAQQGLKRRGGGGIEHLEAVYAHETLSNVLYIPVLLTAVALKVIARPSSLKPRSSYSSQT